MLSLIIIFYKFAPCRSSLKTQVSIKLFYHVPHLFGVFLRFYVAQWCFFSQQIQIGTIIFANLDRFKSSRHSFQALLCALSGYCLAIYLARYVLTLSADWCCLLRALPHETDVWYECQFQNGGLLLLMENNIYWSHLTQLQLEPSLGFEVVWSKRCRYIMHKCAPPLPLQWEWVAGWVLIGRVPESHLHLGQAALALNTRPPPFLPAPARPPTVDAARVAFHTRLHTYVKHASTRRRRGTLDYRVIKHADIHG